MSDTPETLSLILVTLQQVGNTICNVQYPMSLQDNTPGQRWYCTGPGVTPYGECFEVTDSAGTGTTWVLYLLGDGTCYPSSAAYTLDRVPDGSDPVATYSTGSRLAAVQPRTNLG